MAHEMSEELKRTLDGVITDFALLAEANKYLATLQANSRTDSEQDGFNALSHCLACYGLMLVEEKNSLIFG